MPDDLEATLRKIRDQGPDCLAYLGYGYPTILMGPMFPRLGWNPPRIMTTAFQFCYAKPEWMAALEGWHGIDQICEDNPRLAPMLQRFKAKTGSTKDHTVIALSYDTARLIAEGIAPRQPADPARREGRPRKGAHAARRQRRPPHPHEPRPPRPQSLQGRLAPGAQDRGRTDGVRGAV